MNLVLFDGLGRIKSISFEIICLGNHNFSSIFKNLTFEIFSVTNLSILSLVLFLKVKLLFLSALNKPTPSYSIFLQDT